MARHHHHHHRRPSVRKLHGGWYQNIKKGSPRFHQRFRLGPGNEHRYKSGVVIGRRKPQPFDPLQPLTGRAFEQQLNQGVSYQFRPQEQELGSQRRISDQAQRNVDSWYGGYLNEVSKAAAASQQAYSGAQKAAYGQANQSAAQDTQALQAQQAEQQKSAALRGTTASGAGEGQQAVAYRHTADSSLGGLIGAQGANTGAYMADKRRIGAMARVGEHQNESSRRRQIESAASQLAQQKGDYRSQLRSQMTDSERKYALERQTFGLQVAQQGERTRHNLNMEHNVRRGQNIQKKINWAKIHRTDRTYRLNVQKFGVTKGRDIYQRKHGLGPYKPASSGRGGGGGRTPTQRHNDHIKYQQAVGLLRSGTVGPKHHQISIRHALLTNPHRWKHQILAQLQAKYGRRIAIKALRRFMRTTIRGYAHQHSGRRGRPGLF